MHVKAATMRTSEAERQRVAEFLRDACADGRLAPDELEHRLDGLFAGRTVRDIEELVWDLPGGSAVVPRLGYHRGRTPVPVRRRPPSPVRPVGLVLFVVGVVALVAASLPPLLAFMLAVVGIGAIVAVGVLAVALAPVGLALVGLAWLIDRVLNGRRPMPPRARAARHRHPFL
jgi:hypothetical protein